MRLSVFDIDGQEHYEACVYEGGNTCLLCEYYTTKSEAIKAVKNCKKSYKGNYDLDCFVRLHDVNGMGIADYDL